MISRKVPPKRFLGLDISSSSTGWNIVEVRGKSQHLVEYGLISPVGSMGVTQRLYFFGNELNKLIEKFQPHEIAVEETILVRGPKIMRTLSRFSGTALFLAYSYQKREIATYEPSSWKKNLGLKGNAKKPEIQLKVCERFDLIDRYKIGEYQLILDDLIEKEKRYKKESTLNVKKEEANLKYLEKVIKKDKSDLKKAEKFASKKRGLSEEEIEERQESYKLQEDFFKQKEINFKKEKEDFKQRKKEYRDVLREISKGFEKVSIDIYSDSGINADIADSVGVTLKAIDEKK